MLLFISNKFNFLISQLKSRRKQNKEKLEQVCGVVKCPRQSRFSIFLNHLSKYKHCSLRSNENKQADDEGVKFE